MNKSLLEIYALAVCFATIVCFVISLGVAIYSIVEIINPEFTMNSYEYKRYQNNDAYWLRRVDDYRNKEKEMQRPSEDELTKQRTEGYRLAVISEKHDGYQGLTKTGIIILINILVFFIHWRIAQRARETNIAT
ncbi:MAG: hypothetical protein MUO63_16170 [Desulfobulbaceae bacterium]|nr:hypothetical protein [Desulfobulbaceae bacterium]